MIEWSQGAEQQLFEILLSFSTKTTFEKFEKQLNTALEQLETFPESARMNPVLYRSDFRSFRGESQLVFNIESRDLYCENFTCTFEILLWELEEGFCCKSKF